jgi:transcriptional regulator with XRE-family HTH domain
MVTKKTSTASDAALAAARKRAEETRRKLQQKPRISELLTPQERADAAPFYFVLRAYIQQLKEAREAAGLTLADVSECTGMAVESLSRLETGAQTNPTWKTLGQYALAVERRPHLIAESSDSPHDSELERRPTQDAETAVKPVIKLYEPKEFRKETQSSTDILLETNGACVAL